MSEFVKIKYDKFTEIRTKKLLRQAISDYIHAPEPEISAITLELKKSDKYKLNKVTTKTRVYAPSIQSESDIELLQLRRYFATIRTLEHNCRFVRKALNINNDQYLDDLSNLSFSYISDNVSQDSTKLTKSLLLNATRNEIELSYYNISGIILQSIKLVEDFEKKISPNILSNYIKDFESIYSRTLSHKEKMISEAKIILNYLHTDKGKKLLAQAASQISNTTLLKK